MKKKFPTFNSDAEAEEFVASSSSVRARGSICACQNHCSMR